MMNSDIPYRVFISYTGQDLEAHAEVVSDMIQRLNSDTGRSWVAIDHKFWAPTGRPSVKECIEQVERCQILVVLVAFRYGWVPSQEEGGDGESSITRIEVESARAAGLEVIPFLSEENATWNIADVEGLTNPVAGKRHEQFKAKLRNSLAGFFETPESLEAPIVLALNKVAERIERLLVPPRGGPYRQDRQDEADLLVPAYFDREHPPTLEERLGAQLPKRILSLDSGGVRTAIVLGYLERLEQLLRVRYGDMDFRLSDYFDLIGASGESAIIAAELARGRSVVEARKTFIDGMEAMLSNRSIFRDGILRAMYSTSPLLKVLDASFGGMELRSEELKTGIGIVLTRNDTGEIYSLTNHPRVRSSKRGSLPLSHLLQASASKPVFMPPVKIPVAGDPGIFFSGEICIGPDPALHLFLVATGPTFPFRWRTGRRRIFLTSIGAGILPTVKTKSSAIALFAISDMTSSMLRGMKQESHLALAAKTHQDTREVSKVIRGGGAAEITSSILSYKRFDVLLDASTLKEIGLSELADDIDSIKLFDRVDQIGSHLIIGRRAGNRDLDQGLFSASFDVRPKFIDDDG